MAEYKVVFELKFGVHKASVKIANFNDVNGPHRQRLFLLMQQRKTETLVD